MEKLRKDEKANDDKLQKEEEEVNDDKLQKDKQGQR